VEPDPLRSMRHAVIVGDVVAVVVAVLITVVARFLGAGELEYTVPVLTAGGAVMTLWLAALAVMGAYDMRILATGMEEYRRVLAASLAVLGVVTWVSYVLGLEVTRGLVLLGIPVGVVLLLEARWILRRRLATDRRRGLALSRTIVVGDREHAQAMAAALAADPAAGLRAVATLPPPRPRENIDSWLSDLQRQVVVSRAHAVALTSHPALTPDVVRAIGWRLEGPRVDLLVSPAFADIGGPRITVRQAAGLPLIHLDEPQLTGPKRFAKRAMDLIGAGVLLLVTAPLVALLALGIRLTSPGPAFYRQERIGQSGRPFVMWKLRSMTMGADAHPFEAQARAASTGAGKPHRDVRVTPLGRFMRRWSLDELPQLWNVVRNDMSLVGPRPLIVGEDAHLLPAMDRRHLTKPGVTGLWQVSGRADTTWAERMRLDLTYVEQWSLMLDIVIIVRTLRTVVSRSGAY
jgi:exopolysaccharide biosynthesis polyprenyl glycosylphosphotransferase